MVRDKSLVIALAYGYPVFLAPLAKETFFLLHVLVVFVKNQLVANNMDLFSGSLLSSIGQCVCFYTSTTLYGYCSFLVCIEVRYCNFSSIILFAQVLVI
jgi:hypothetical protein